MCNASLIVSGHGRLNNEVIKLGLEDLFAVNLPVIFSFLYFIAFHYYCCYYYFTLVCLIG